MPFSEVRHQPGAVAALGSALATGRLPHGFIFCGPAGVGKALAARALAAILLCDAPKAGRGKGEVPAACGKCDQCRLTGRNLHPDLNWFRKLPEKAEFTIGVVTRRDDSPEGLTVNESVQLKPMQARCRVTVIEDAEMMNVAAANAFLKTFEEAPEGSYLILLVTSLDRLLPTIRSRGRLVRFNALPPEFVAELLEREWRMSREEAGLVARFAEGSMDRAAGLARSGFLAIRGEIMQALPALNRVAALGLADAIHGWASEQAKSEVETDAKVEENQLRRLHVKQALGVVALVFRDALLAGAGLGDSRLTNADAAPFIRTVAARLPRETVERGVRRFLEFQAYVDRNVHNQLLLENACLELSDLLAPARG